MTTESRVVCDKCGQHEGGFHKGCDGLWVEQQREVTEWTTTGPATVHGAIARAAALVAQDPEWWSATRWPRR